MGHYYCCVLWISGDLESGIKSYRLYNEKCTMLVPYSLNTSFTSTYPLSLSNVKEGFSNVSTRFDFTICILKSCMLLFQVAFWFQSPFPLCGTFNVPYKSSSWRRNFSNRRLLLKHSSSSLSLYDFPYLQNWVYVHLGIFFGNFPFWQ